VGNINAKLKSFVSKNGDKERGKRKVVRHDTGEEVQYAQQQRKRITVVAM